MGTTTPSGGRPLSWSSRFLAVGLLILSQTANPSGDSSADFRGQTLSQVMPGEREVGASSSTSTTDDSARHQTHDRTIAFIEDIAAENIHLLTNIARSENGVLSRLGGSDEVRRIAKAHSAAMLEAGQLNHVLNGKGPTDRAMDAGYDCEVHMGDGVYEYGLSENIAFLSGYSGLSGREDAQMLARKFMERWRNSPEHWGNILDRDARSIWVWG